MFLFKGIILIIILILAVVITIAAIVLGIVWKGFRFMKRMSDSDDARTNRHNRDYTGYRQQQYGYRQQRTTQQQDSHQNRRPEPDPQQEQRQSRQSYSDNRTTIVDMRDPRKSERRIFDDQEGEYIEFEEE